MKNLDMATVCRTGPAGPDGVVRPSGPSVLEVEFSDHLQIALALRTAQLSEQRRGDGLRCRAGERRRVGKAVGISTQHEVLLLGDVELLAQRQIQLAQSGSSN